MAGRGGGWRGGSRTGGVAAAVRCPGSPSGSPSAINLDVQSSDFAARLAALDVSKSYAVYCQSGHRSELALEKLAAAGFTHVVDLTGGVPAWTAQGYPLVDTP
ncbi:hypothetical protein BH11ACT1_BH11ACT1_03760 [soil metagenome]